jgi:hypothetical protein
MAIRDFQLKKYPKISCGAGILPANNTRTRELGVRSFSFGDATRTELWFFQRENKGLRLLRGVSFPQIIVMSNSREDRQDLYWACR